MKSEGQRNINAMIVRNLQTFYNTRAFFALLIIIAFQNILAMFFAKRMPVVAQAIFVTKEFYIAIVIFLVTLLILMTGRMKKELVIPFGMILYLLVVSAFASPYFNFVSLRQALILPVFLIFGFYFAGSIDIEKLSKWVFNIFFIAILLGLFERLFIYNENETFFKALGIREWANMKGFGYGIPRSWYSSDLFAWTGERIRRMPGILIGDAVNFGQSLAFPLVYAFLMKKYIAALIIFIAVLLSMSKGGLIASIVALGLYLSFERLTAYKRYLLWFAVLLIVSGIVYAGLDYVKQIGSVMLHFRGGYTNVINLFDNTFGGGVGSGGNFARRFGSIATSDAFGLSTKRLSDISILAYGESYFGTMLSQFGIFGLFLYFYYPVKLLRTKIPRRERFRNIVKYSALGLFAVGLFAESAFTYVGTGFVVAMIPLALRTYGHNETIQVRQKPFYTN